ncbi:MAG: response regulator [Chitinophagales bacterium]
MIKTIIIDDEPLARSMVMEYLRAYPEISVVQECNDGFEGVKAIQQHQPDLVFLDIQMPKINGFEMLELIEQPPAVIFTTAFEEYAIRAFDAHAIDYLLKPFSKERFDQALKKWMDQWKSGTLKSSVAVTEEVALHLPTPQQRIVVKVAGKIKIIPMQDIQYLEAADDYVKINTAEGYFLKSKTMNYFEQVMDAQQFVRTHRSFMVNVQQINRIDPYEKDGHLAILKGGQKIPVSKTGYGKLKQVLGL